MNGYGGTIRQIRPRGRDEVTDRFTLALLAVNLRRPSDLLATKVAMAGCG